MATIAMAAIDTANLHTLPHPKTAFVIANLLLLQSTSNTVNLYIYKQSCMLPCEISIPHSDYLCDLALVWHV